MERIRELLRQHQRRKNQVVIPPDILQLHDLNVLGPRGFRELLLRDVRREFPTFSSLNDESKTRRRTNTRTSQFRSRFSFEKTEAQFGGIRGQRKGTSRWGKMGKGGGLTFELPSDEIGTANQACFLSTKLKALIARRYDFARRGPISVNRPLTSPNLRPCWYIAEAATRTQSKKRTNGESQFSPSRSFVHSFLSLPFFPSSTLPSCESSERGFAESPFL